MGFIHLHLHSAYSFLEGVGMPAELAQAAARCEMRALALTDHDSLTGAIEFYAACQAAGVRPILGLDLETAAPPQAPLSREPPALTLLATDLAGWGSLCRLSSALQTPPQPGPRRPLPFETLARETAGLLCLADVNRLIHLGQEAGASLALEQLRDLYAARLYVALSAASAEDEAAVPRVARLARRLSQPAVAVHPVYYLTPDQAHLQRLLTAIRLNCPLSAVPDRAAAPADAHFLPPAEMAQRLAAYPEALAATEEIADRCRLELPSAGRITPR